MLLDVVVVDGLQGGSRLKDLLIWFMGFGIGLD
jgi:hypothetical protein